MNSCVIKSSALLAATCYAKSAADTTVNLRNHLGPRAAYIEEDFIGLY